jgi:hypothetical protein
VSGFVVKEQRGRMMLNFGDDIGAAYLNGRGKGARWDSTTDPYVLPCRLFYRVRANLACVWRAQQSDQSDRELQRKDGVRCRLFQRVYGLPGKKLRDADVDL